MTAERRPTNLGAKRCLAWMIACRDIGWQKSEMNRLVDLWWEHHDDNGDLIEPERTAVQPKDSKP